jgi:hypothetical protein
MRNYLVLGDWNAICDRCGFRFKASALRKEWTGLMVCDRCWEPKHPQLLIRVPQEHVSPPWARPEAQDVFVGPQEISTEADITAFLTTESGVNLLTEN